DPESGRKNLETLAAATLEASLAPPRPHARYARHAAIVEELSALAFRSYRSLVKDTPGFVAYYRASTPIAEIAELNMRSRPASRYAELVPDEKLRRAIFPRIAEEWQRARRALAQITGNAELLAGNPTLARSIRNRFPYLDPLNHLQVELLRRYRAGSADKRL